MARETITKLIDDLDGTTAHETVRFGLDGHTYEIDLSSKNAKKLRDQLVDFINHAVKVRADAGTRSGRGATRVQLVTTREQRDQNQAIRDWATRKGYEVAPRGRIRQEIVDEFHTNSGR